ncbi:hypothetical protein AGMMS50284_6050 [Clostridia bacterium]|nr:hypothetical protein AGMMS50284_6050 [Clostridia bacterium]
MKTLFFESVTNITVPVLKQYNIKCIFLDVDNTVKPHGATVPDECVSKWINQIKEADVKIILFSNNYKKNVEPFANNICCDFVSFCLKPSPIGFIRAKIKSKEKHKNILVVGDQVFTDIFGGKILFFKTALVNPIDEEIESKTVKLRRFLLKGITEKIKGS